MRLRGGVVATVFRNEVRLAAGSYQLWVPALLLIALMVLAAVSFTARHRGDAAEQAEIEAAYVREVQGATLDELVEIPVPALKPPWRLALVVGGGQTATPDVHAQALSALLEPELRRAPGEDPRLSRQDPPDWMFAVRAVLSIGAFLLCHGALCGERQGGTLKLLFTFPIPRWKLLLGKFLGAWACVAGPFLAGAAASLLLAAGSGDLRPGAGDLARAALGIGLGLWAAAFFVLVGFLVSSSTRGPATSLGILALLWVLSVVAVPALGVLLARILLPAPTDAEIADRIAGVRVQAERELAGQGERWRQPKWAAADGYAWEKISARVENRRSALQREIRHQVLDRKLQQAALARTLSSLSPAWLVQDVAERLIGTGLERDRAFLQQAWAFHADVERRMRQLDAADPESPHILFFRGYVSQRPLEPHDLPRFVFRERTLLEGLVSAGPALVAFALETLLLAAVTLYVFSRYDAG